MPRKNKWDEIEQAEYTVPDPTDERQQAIKDAQAGNNYVAPEPAPAPAPEPTPAPKPERDQTDTRGEEVAAAREGNNYAPPVPAMPEKPRHPELQGAESGAPDYAPPPPTTPPVKSPFRNPKDDIPYYDTDILLRRTANSVRRLLGMNLDMEAENALPRYKARPNQGFVPPQTSDYKRKPEEQNSQWTGDPWETRDTASRTDMTGVSDAQTRANASAVLKATEAEARKAGIVLTTQQRADIVQQVSAMTPEEQAAFMRDHKVAPPTVTGGTTPGGAGGEDINTLANKFASGQITQEEMSRLALQFGVDPKAVLDKVSQIRTGAQNGGGGSRPTYQAPGTPGTTTPGATGQKNFTEVPMPDGYESLLDRVMSAAGYTKTGSRSYTGTDVPITSALVYGLVNDPAQVAWLRNFFMQQKMWKEV